MFSKPKKMLLASLILGCSLHTPIKAIDEDTAKKIAITSGILVGGASALGVHLGLQHCLTNPNKALLLASPIIGMELEVGIALGYVTEHFLYQWLYAKTPSAKIAAKIAKENQKLKLVKDCVQSKVKLELDRILKFMQEAQKNLINYIHDELITKNFDSDELFIAYITKRVGTQVGTNEPLVAILWPLVVAHQYLINVPPKLKKEIEFRKLLLRDARNCLELAMKEIQTNNKKYAALLQECKYLQKKIENIEACFAQYVRNITLIEKIIENKVNTITSYPQFTSQVALHESHIQHEKMLEQQKQQRQQELDIERSKLDIKKRKLAQEQSQFAQQQVSEVHKLALQHLQFAQQTTRNCDVSLRNNNVNLLREIRVEQEHA